MTLAKLSGTPLSPPISVENVRTSNDDDDEDNEEEEEDNEVVGEGLTNRRPAEEGDFAESGEDKGAPESGEA